MLVKLVSLVLTAQVMRVNWMSVKLETLHHISVQKLVLLSVSVVRMQHNHHNNNTKISSSSNTGTCVHY